MVSSDELSSLVYDVMTLRLNIIQSYEQTDRVFSQLPDLEVLDARNSRGVQSINRRKSIRLLRTCFLFSAAVTVWDLSQDAGATLWRYEGMKSW